MESIRLDFANILLEWVIRKYRYNLQFLNPSEPIDPVEIIKNSKKLGNFNKLLNRIWMKSSQLNMNPPPPHLSTKRLIVRLATVRDVPEILRYYVENQAYLAPFEPHRSHHFYTEQFWREQVEKNFIEFNYKQSLRLFLFPQSQPERIIGSANFTQFVYGVFLNCYLGYSIAEIEQGKGYMAEALRAAIAYVFEELHLHRISANYMPHNQRSGRLLRRLGFTVEGYARDYLMINGAWQDHILTSLINPKAMPRG